jgi:hypothetical protein
MAKHDNYIHETLVIEGRCRVCNDLDRAIADIAVQDHRVIRTKIYLTANAQASALALAEWYGPVEASRILCKIAARFDLKS